MHGQGLHLPYQFQLKYVSLLVKGHYPLGGEDHYYEIEIFSHLTTTKEGGWASQEALEAFGRASEGPTSVQEAAEKASAKTAFAVDVKLIGPKRQLGGFKRQR